MKSAMPPSDPPGREPSGEPGRTSAAQADPAERRCTRNGCQQPALATLTYVYAASTAVVGPLAMNPEPHTYDLCGTHARSLTAPRGWELVRHEGELVPPPPRPDDLAALAEAVWGSGQRSGATGDRRERRGTEPPRPRDRRGHLRVVPPS